MGAGIAQLALENGHEVVLHDVDEAAIERGRARIRDGLARRAAKLDLDADTIDDWVDGRLAGLRESASLDGLGAEAEVIVEAALEDLALKRTIFRTLDAAAPPETILATNTSALSIAAIAAATNRQGRVIGMHFFNPAPVLKLVEVIRGLETSDETARAITELAGELGKTAAEARDFPGFVSNRILMPFINEAVWALHDGVAEAEAIDTIARLGFAHPLGPLALADLIGLDTCVAIMEVLRDGLDDERYAPCPLLQQLVSAGKLGRKSGAGFFIYQS